MKNPTRFYGILLLILGFVLCVVNAFFPGMIFILVGLFMAAAGQPKKTNEGKAPVRRHAQIKPPVLVPGAPAEDAYAYQGSADDYFAALLQGCFPAYRTEQNVSVSVLTSSGITSWECRCGTANTGKFCSDCGSRCPNTPVSAFDPVPDGATANITFLLSSGTQPQLAILLCDKNRWNNLAIRNTMEACKRAGTPCLRFIRDFRNRGDYVVDRIRSALR